MSEEVSRRTFLCAVAGCVAAAAGGCGDFTHTGFFRKNFRDLSKEEIDRIIGDLEKDHSAQYGKRVVVGVEPAKPGVEFGYALDISRCIGCRSCVYGCVEENNQSRDPQVHWIRVLEMEQKHGIDFAHSNPYYDPATVPQDGKFYLPVACQHCENPPCVKSCPVGATWQEPDGITVIDYDWCIGCRCCVAACPYGARHFNWTDPNIPARDDPNLPAGGFSLAARNREGVPVMQGMNPQTHYLGNRPRMKGVVEKCTFCIQRVRNGQYPKCVEVCPTGARKFGNLRDPNSEIRKVLADKRVVVLKAELNTRPRFFYFFG